MEPSSRLKGYLLYLFGKYSYHDIYVMDIAADDVVNQDGQQLGISSFAHQMQGALSDFWI